MSSVRTNAVGNGWPPICNTGPPGFVFAPEIAVETFGGISLPWPAWIDQGHVRDTSFSSRQSQGNGIRISEGVSGGTFSSSQALFKRAVQAVQDLLPSSNGEPRGAAGGCDGQRWLVRRIKELEVDEPEGEPLWSVLMGGGDGIWDESGFGWATTPRSRPAVSESAPVTEPALH